VFGTPALSSRSLIAVANARGSSAPKTNVARSTLEVTPERDALFSTLYGLYVDHVKNEIDRLMEEENYSLTWAANNAIMLVPFGFADNREALLPSELREHMKGLPVYIVEKNGKRINTHFNDLIKEEQFWTVDCQLVDSAEGLVREAKANSTVANIIAALGDKAQALPQGTILFNMDVSTMLRDSVELEFEPIQVKTSESLRRADIEWGARTPHKWIRVQEIINRNFERTGANQLDVRLKQYLDEMIMRSGDSRTSIRARGSLWLAADDIPFLGNGNYCGISSYYRTFLRGDIKITKFLRELATGGNDEDVWRRLNVFSAVFSAVAGLGLDRASIAGNQLRRIQADLGEEVTRGSDQFMEALSESPSGLFDTSVWSRRDMT
jgi:molecular chaperone HtpG